MLNHKLKDRKDEVKVSALAMLKERCRDPNAKDWTMHNYKDSVKMGTPIVFEKLEEMKSHWQSCLSLVAQPAIAPLDKGKGVGKGRGRGRGPPARGGHSMAGLVLLLKR